MEPSYRRSRREALVAGLLWLLCGCWVVTASFLLGHNQPVRSLGGVPHWVVWGIFLPWVVFFLIHCWYSLVYMRDDPPENADPLPDPPHAEDR